MNCLCKVEESDKPQKIFRFRTKIMYPTTVSGLLQIVQVYVDGSSFSYRTPFSGGSVFLLKKKSTSE